MASVGAGCPPKALYAPLQAVHRHEKKPHPARGRPPPPPPSSPSVSHHRRRHRFPVLLVLQLPLLRMVHRCHPRCVTGMSIILLRSPPLLPLHRFRPRFPMRWAVRGRPRGWRYRGEVHDMHPHHHHPCPRGGSLLVQAGQPPLLEWKQGRRRSYVFPWNAPHTSCGGPPDDLLVPPRLSRGVPRHRGIQVVVVVPFLHRHVR